MNYRVRRHEGVEVDLLTLAHWIARDSLPAAVRFLDAADETIIGLSFMPKRGSLKGWRGARHAGIRTVSVRGFPNHLVVYDVRDDGVFAIAVVHGAQNYSRLIRKRSSG